MSGYIEPAENLSEAWLRTIEHVQAQGGYAVNLMTTVLDPLAMEDMGIRQAVDSVLVEGYRGSSRVQTVDTVAGTIFPHDLYADPGYSWSPRMAPDEAALLDQAAADMYEAYFDMLPVLTTDTANARGTYFGRMTTWPGKTGGGTNQVADRIKSLRRVRALNYSKRNLEDIAIGGEAEGLSGGLPDEPSEEEPTPGLQVLKANDRRPRGFPCLVHIDLTLFDGKLSMAAVYRHQYLITKAYGNLLGLSRLLVFLAQQTGYEVGELVINATMADSQQDDYTKAGVTEIVTGARAGAGT